MSTDTGLPADASSVESRRQRAIDALGLGVPLEQRRDDRFDRITRLARTVFGTTLASITVLDGDCAWFPSAQGFEPAVMPREDVFCDRTHRVGEVTVVPDATVDPHYSHLPIVAEGGIRFYAGAPLRDPLGNVVGTFCLFDTTPRTLDAEELQTLQDLAAWAQQELVASSEMLRASRVQAAMLPATPIVHRGWHVEGICLPALTVGGDLFDFALTNGVVHVGLGDVMGKGTGAALIGAGVRAAVRSTHPAVVAGADLGTTTHRVARTLHGDLDRGGAFVTLFQCAIDVEDGSMRYVDAGAGLCVVVRADGSVERIVSEDRPIGILDDDTWTEHRTRLDPGDRMLVFSDGLFDLLEDQREWWREVGRLVTDHHDPSGTLDAVRDLAASRLNLDDVTAVVVHRSAEDAR
jgi:hypothetical protein